MKPTEDLNKGCKRLANNKQKPQEGHTKLTKNDHSKTDFLAFPLKIIISPFKTLREIVQNPDIKGIVLIAGLVLLATTGLYCAYSSKVFLLIDGTPTSFLYSNMFSGFIFSVLSQSVLLFVFNWLIYSGVLFLVMRAFGLKGGAWRLFFILVGYAFSIMIIQSAISALLIATLPEIHFSNLNTWPPSTEDEIAVANTGIQENWGPTPSYQAIAYFNFPLINIIDLWLLMLSIIIVHTFNEISWGKAVTISVTAFILRFFLKIFLGV